MTYEQKLACLQSLGEVRLFMREPSDWGASVFRLEVKFGNMLRGACGNGPTPEAAVCDLWRKATELEPGERLVLDAYSSTGRKEYRWNGYRWEELRVEAKS